jgi:hypothetical protein
MPQVDPILWKLPDQPKRKANQRVAEKKKSEEADTNRVRRRVTTIDDYTTNAQSSFINHDKEAGEEKTKEFFIREGARWWRHERKREKTRERQVPCARQPTV